MSKQLAVDISNYNGYLAGAWFHDRLNEGFTHCVVRLGYESQQHIDIAQHQMRMAHQAGMTVSIYIWGYWGMNPEEHVRHALDLGRATGVPFTWVWIDAEDGEQFGAEVITDWLMRASGELYTQGFNPGIYTGGWWWDGRTSLGSAMSHLPLWYSNYQTVPQPEINWDQEHFGGWERAMVVGKQYRGDPLDLSTFEYPPVAGEETDDTGQEDPAVIAELQAQIAELRAEIATKNTVIGYLTHDVSGILDMRADEMTGELSALLGDVKEMRGIATEMRRNAVS